jgi:hypothetical protein
MNNPKSRQEWIYETLTLEGLGFSEMFSKYSEKFSKSEVTFNKDWCVANERYIEYQNKANKAKEEASIAKEVEAVKQGLKTKNERLLIYQSQVDNMLLELETKQCYDDEGNMRAMTQRELNDTRKTLQVIQSEISKIEGDYAPTKTANTDSSGNDVDSPLDTLIKKGGKIVING